jgi:hypothetical protein
MRDLCILHSSLPLCLMTMSPQWVGVIVHCVVGVLHRVGIKHMAACKDGSSGATLTWLGCMGCMVSPKDSPGCMGPMQPSAGCRVALPFWFTWRCNKFGSTCSPYGVRHACSHVAGVGSASASAQVPQQSTNVCMHLGFLGD